MITVSCDMELFALRLGNDVINMSHFEMEDHFVLTHLMNLIGSPHYLTDSEV